MQGVAGKGCQRNSARSGFDRVSTLMFGITWIIAFLVLQWSDIIVTVDEDLRMSTTDVSSLPIDHDDTRRFLLLPFLNGLSIVARSLCSERNLAECRGSLVRIDSE